MINVSLESRSLKRVPNARIAIEENYVQNRLLGLEHTVRCLDHTWCRCQFKIFCIFICLLTSVQVSKAYRITLRTQTLYTHTVVWMVMSQAGHTLHSSFPKAAEAIWMRRYISAFCEPPFEFVKQIQNMAHRETNLSTNPNLIPWTKMLGSIFASLGGRSKKYLGFCEAYR